MTNENFPPPMERTPAMHQAEGMSKYTEVELTTDEISEYVALRNPKHETELLDDQHLLAKILAKRNDNGAAWEKFTASYPNITFAPRT